MHMVKVILWGMVLQGLYNESPSVSDICSYRWWSQTKLKTFVKIWASTHILREHETPPFRWRWHNKNLSICFFCWSDDLSIYLSIRLSIFFDPQGWNIYAKNNPMTDIDILYITNTCPLCSVYVIITSYPIQNSILFSLPFLKWPPGETTGGNHPKRSFNCSKILREPRKTIDQLSELRKHWKHKSTCLEDHPN